MNISEPVITRLTFRDEIAMRVLPALVTRNCENRNDIDMIAHISAKDAYIIADALIEAKGKPPTSRYGKKK